MRVVVAGHGPLMQQKLAALRATTPDLTVEAEVHTEGELFLALRTLHPDVVVIDTSLRLVPSKAWIDYLHLLSAPTQIIWVESDAGTLTAS